jgi:hypothetical protein
MGDFHLEPGDFDKIRKALQIWVSGHPSSNTPFLLVAGKTVTPRQLIVEIEEQSESGLPFLKYLTEEAERTKLPVDEPIFRAIRVNQGR